MPICNEHVATVFAGLRATAESIVAAGGARLVELYVLSDSSDPALRAAEHQAWAALRERLAATGLQVHYRWRARRTHRKAGNVADFCRRWGPRHRYMVVLDADSVMSGEAVLGLMRLMEAHPRAGIIQSAPVACGLDTVHARTQQFAGRVTGRLFGAGMQFWQLGESHYWGHNAIIRIAPFMEHCGLAPLPGRGGLSGHILSHDFVEAALMRRAGWQVWLVPDLPGSWEQQPPHLLAELQRDRRWCQGNLKNARLITEPGLHRVHRAMLGTGAMAYLSAPLWLGFVVLGLVLWLRRAKPHQRRAGAQRRAAGRAVGCHAGAAAAAARPGRGAGAAGRPAGAVRRHAALLGSAVLEALMSALQAPLRMAAHTVFVVGALTGLKLQWKSPPREAERLPWRDAAPALLPLVAAGRCRAGRGRRVRQTAAAPTPARCCGCCRWRCRCWRPGRWRCGPGARRWAGHCAAAGLLLTPEEVLPAPALRNAWANAAWANAAPAASGNEPYFKPMQLA